MVFTTPTIPHWLEPFDKRKGPFTEKLEPQLEELAQRLEPFMNPRGKVYAGQHDYGYLPYPDANYDTRAMAHALQPHVPSIEQPLREYESLLAQTKKDVETLGGHFVGEMYVPSGNPSNHPRRGTSVDAQLCIVTLGLYGLYALWRDRGRGYTASEERHYQLQNAHQKVRDALYIALHQRAEDQNGGEEK